jgi:hypothetical protein
MQPRGGALEVRGETGDVMAFLDRDRGDAVLGRAREREVDRLDHQPGPRQPPAIPTERAAMVGDDRGLAVPGHAAVLERAQIGRGERQAMGRVPEQISLEQHLGDGRRLVLVKAGRAEQRRREPHQRLRWVNRILAPHARLLLTRDHASSQPRLRSGCLPRKRSGSQHRIPTAARPPPVGSFFHADLGKSKGCRVRSATSARVGS